jgi:ComF family protein
VRPAFQFSADRTSPANVSSLLRELADSVFAALLPSGCPTCGRELSLAVSAGLCGDCWSQITPWTGPACAHCGLPFASVAAADAAEPLCAPCRREDYEFDLARSFGLHTGVLRSAVLLLKYTRRERLGFKLGELLWPAWEIVQKASGVNSPIIVPVPLHRSRRRTRGFNQAEALAQGLRRTARARGAGSDFVLQTHCLERTRPTPPQAGLTWKARWENVRGVFRVTSADRVRGRVVLLVDDVMTTGATLSACASALKRAGTGQVLGLTLARATPRFPDLEGSDFSEAVDESGQAQT